MANQEQLAFLLRAIKFAADKHRFQKRKDKATPYINHPVEVMETLAGVGKVEDVEILAAAVLHDSIEDTETTVDELRTIFGDRVTFLVQEVSDDKSLPKAERKKLQEEHAPRLSAGAKQIKIADKVSNMRDMSDSPPPDWNWQRRSEYVEWCRRVFQGLKGVNSDLDVFFERRYEYARKLLDERRPSK